MTAQQDATLTNGTPEESPLKHSGYYLRWSRLQKSVEVKEQSGGLLRSSIASSAPAVAAASSDAGSRRKSLAASSSFSFRRGSSAVGSNQKVILDRVSGCCAPGEILAAMGPSGSGKTSLLNTLSGRSAYNSGTISINGEVIPNTGSAGSGMKRLMSKIAYVKQADIFFEHLTVRDQFTYTALLRLSSDKMNTGDKVAEVDRIIELLRLEKVAESPIKLLSGGEKKRVNIGTELLTEPMILLLDEPTSGLDSTSAVALLQLLHQLAKGDETNPPKTVITSIHQPNSAVFRSFDKLIMLSEGKVVYFGSPVASLDYLRTLNLACPEGYNAADHWMDLCHDDTSNLQLHLQVHGKDSDQYPSNDTPENREESKDEDNKYTESQDGEDELKQLLAPSRSPRLELQEAWDHEALAELMDSALEDLGETSRTANTDVSLTGHGGRKFSKYNTSWATQYWVLTHRSMKNSRSAIFTTINLIKSVCIGLVAGCLWWQMEYTEERVHDRSSYYFFTMTFWVFDSMMGALMAFPAERSVILKERASGSYHLSAYFLAKTTSDAPVRLTLPFLYMATSYWMAGVDNRFWVFVSSTCCTLLSVLAGESMGLLVGASIRDMTKALTTMIVIGLSLMLAGGFYVQNIPSFISWIQYLSPFKYAFAASLHIVFRDAVPCDGSGNLEALCGGGNDFGSAKGSDVVDFLGATGSLGFNIGMLFVICLLPRYGAYLSLRAQKAGERS